MVKSKYVHFGLFQCRLFFYNKLHFRGTTAPLGTTEHARQKWPLLLFIISLPYWLPSWYFGGCHVTFGKLNRGVRDGHHREWRQSGWREEKRDMKRNKQSEDEVKWDGGGMESEMEGLNQRKNYVSQLSVSKCLFSGSRWMHINCNDVSVCQARSFSCTFSAGELHRHTQSDQTLKAC